MAMSYPTALEAMNAAGSLVSALRGGYAANKSRIHKDLWIVGGYGQGILFADPDLAREQLFGAVSGDMEFVEALREVGRAAQGSDDADMQLFGNDIIEFWEKFVGQGAVLDFLKGVLKAVYDLIGREWNHG